MKMKVRPSLYIPFICLFHALLYRLIAIALSVYVYSMPYSECRKYEIIILLFEQLHKHKRKRI
jgi:hypothetical protein